MLIAIPTAVFVLPDLIGGHLLLTGDNLQQNFPLHVLVGSMLRHGQLPFWNQYIFSGTPLMADFNAGAFYPLTGAVRRFCPIGRRGSPPRSSCSPPSRSGCTSSCGR